MIRGILKCCPSVNKKKQKSLFLPFILIKFRGGYITFEDSNWFHRKEIQTDSFTYIQQVAKKGKVLILNIGKFKSKFYIKEINLISFY